METTSEMVYRKTFGSAHHAIQTFSEFSGGSYMVPVFGAIFVIIAIAIAVVYYIQYTTKRPTKELLGPIDLFNPTSPAIVDLGTVKKSMSNSYTLAFYVQLDAVPDMRMKNATLFTWPGVLDVAYDAAQEQLIWTFSEIQHNEKADGPQTIVVKSITLQRWNQIVFTFEGRTADIYCNGTLISSTTLDNVPPFPNSSITVVPRNILGKIAYIQVWPRRLPTSEVASNYIETSDSQGRPYLGPDFFKALKIPNIFAFQCKGTDIPAGQNLQWEFPYR
jgi:hypothetical protein